MKSFGLVVLSAILSVSATPLGDRVVFRRHNGIPLSRRYVLESRMTPPPACAAAPAAIASGTTTSPDPSSTDIPVAVSNSSVPAVADPATAAAPADNSTVADNSTTAAAPAAAPPASRRFWTRGHHGFDDGFDGSFSEHDSVSFSFEEEVSTFVQTWEDLCISSGGDIFTDDPCNTLGGFGSIDALMENADPCDQQNFADSMITFAKSEGITNRDDLINFAISYRKHARNSVEILGVVPSSLYCLDAPVNSELDGIYNDQLEGCDPGMFGSPSTPLVPFGYSGTCPYDMTANVDTCGCTSTDGTDTSAATSTDTADASLSTDAASTDSTSTDTADASLSTDAVSTDSTPTDTAAAAAVTPPPPTATDATAQPADISGNVNDPNGRR